MLSDKFNVEFHMKGGSVIKVKLKKIAVRREGSKVTSIDWTSSLKDQILYVDLNEVVFVKCSFIPLLKRDLF